MKPYILTPQQQDVNGYPRHGELNKVNINPLRVVQLQSMPSVKLAFDERICNRCSTIYKVDGSGMQVNR
jgi:RNA exonuclease 1